MGEIKLPVSKGHGFSRRRALKQALLAGAGLAVASSPVQAANSVVPVDSAMSSISESILPAIQQSAPTAGTDYLIFLGQDFRPIHSSCATSDVSFIGIFTTNEGTYFSVSVNLPQQALITEVEFYIWHKATGPVGNVELDFTAAYPSTNGSSNKVKLLYTGVSGGVQTVPLTMPASYRVDNTFYKYQLFWRPDSTSNNDVLFGARVGYKGGTAHFGIY